MVNINTIGFSESKASIQIKKDEILGIPLLKMKGE
jgi:hypothetical protein